MKQQRTKREHGLLSDIEEGLLANKPIADLLRMVIILGGKSGSAELRDWATKELNGYGSGDELPSYRIVAAPILLDGATPYAYISRQSVSPSEFPDFARDVVPEEVSFNQGVGELDAMARQDHSQDVKIAIPGSRELARIVESQSSATQRIDRIYWSVSTIRVAGWWTGFARGLLYSLGNFELPLHWGKISLRPSRRRTLSMSYSMVRHVT